MSKGNTFENDLLKAIFNATPIANLLDNAASSPITHLQVALHTADPGEGGSQNTSEVVYTGYARIAVVRSSSGWVVTDNTVSPVLDIDFADCPPGTVEASAPYWSVGFASSGAGKVMYKGTLNPAITIKAGGIPRIKNTSTITED